jgi:hypothetical protein
MKANTMRNMQVPAYVPALPGVQAFEYRGVPVDVKKTIIMSDMPIMWPDISIVLEEDESEPEGIDIPPMSILAVM